MSMLFKHTLLGGEGGVGGGVGVRLGSGVPCSIMAALSLSISSVFSSNEE